MIVKDNGVRYRDMVTNCFVLQLKGISVADMWFQQDGETINLLHELLNQRVISRNEPVSFPPRSSDLTPFDYFCWGYENLRLYATNN